MDPTPTASTTTPDLNQPTPTTSSSAPILYRIIPTVGDGRCFFRSIAIARDRQLLSAPRDRSSGKIHDDILQLRETFAADALRARTVDYMVQHYAEYDITSGTAAANADMPTNNHYSSLEDRIHSMASSTEMPGNLEIVALSRCLDQPLVIIAQGATYKFGEVAGGKSAITLRYERFGDAGHYELLVA